MQVLYDIQQPVITGLCRALLLVGCILGLSDRLLAQQPAAPVLSKISPLGVQPGQTVQLALTGKNLSGPRLWWAHCGGEATFPATGQSESSALTDWKVPAAARLGLTGVRLGTGAGVSNLRVMLVDDLLTQLDAAQNRTQAMALKLTPPIAVEGTVEAEFARFYQLHLEQNQRLSVEVYARRLGSPLDPVIRLLDSAGNELAYSDDEPGLAGDARLGFTAPQAGDYALELRDIRYAGGPGYAFRLRVGDFPLSSVAFPPVVRRGATAELQLAGEEPTTVAAQQVACPADAPAGMLNVSFKRSGGSGSALTQVLTSDQPESLEQEPNNTTDTATRLTLPQGVSGRFAEPGDQDWYAFSAKQGDRISFLAHSQVFGSPAEVTLSLRSADGTQLATTNPQLGGNALLSATIPADGEYRLLVEDLQRGGGETFVYHLQCKLPAAGFALVVDKDRANPPEHGVFVAKVTVQRTGYAGPIGLSLLNAPAGTVLAGEKLGENQNETLLKVTWPAGITAGSLQQVQIVGMSESATTGGAGEPNIPVRASSLAALRTDLPYLAYLPSDWGDSLAVSAGPPFPAFFSFKQTAFTIEVPQRVGTAALAVTVERLPNFTDAIELQLTGLPVGLTATGTTIEKGKNETTIMLQGGAELPLGVSQLQMLAKGNLQDQPQSTPLAVSLAVIPPLKITLKPAEKLAREGKQKLAITAVRFGTESHPISIKLENLPAGVTAPAEITIPPGVNTIEVELAAALTAELGSTDRLLARGTTKFQDAEITAESPGTILEIVDGK